MEMHDLLQLPAQKQYDTHFMTILCYVTFQQCHPKQHYDPTFFSLQQSLILLFCLKKISH